MILMACEAAATGKLFVSVPPIHLNSFEPAPETITGVLQYIVIRGGMVCCHE